MLISLVHTGHSSESPGVSLAGNHGAFSVNDRGGFFRAQP